MLGLTVVLVLLTVAQGGITVEKMQQPKVVVEDLTSAREYTFMVNETIEVQFPTQYTAFEGKVYDRARGFNYTNVAQDFRNHPELYQESSTCYFNPSYFELDTKSQTIQIQDYKIMSHVVDWTNRCIYVLASDLTVLKSCSNDQQVYLISPNQYFWSIGKLNSTSTNGILYLNTTSNKLYAFLRNQLFVLNETDFVKVTGYFETEFSGDFIVKDSQIFILRPKSGIVIYNFTDFSNCILTYNINKWKTNNISPVDFKFINDQLWVLDSEYGFYTFLLKSVAQPKNSYLIRYGKKLFFEVDKNVTFEIAFELNGDTFVAEMALLSQSLVLNRFYDQINGVKEMVFLDQRLSIIGQQEMMTIQHSTNPTLLLESWQEKSYYSMFGLLQIQPRYANPAGKGVLFTMINGKNITVITYQRNYATVSCFFTNVSELESTVYMQINSTLCKKNDRANMSTSYCNIRYNINFKTVGVVSSLLSLVFTILVILIAVLIFFFMMIYAKKMREKKYDEILALESELRKRMEQEKKTKEISEGVLHQEV